MSTTMNTTSTTSQAQEPSRRKPEQRPSFRLTPYLFLAPALIWYLCFLVYPMYQSLVISFMDWDGLSANIKFHRAGKLSHDLLRGRYGAPGACGTTSCGRLGTLLIPTTIGLLLAVALDRKLRGRTRVSRDLLRAGGAAARRRRHDLGLDVQPAVWLRQRISAQHRAWPVLHVAGSRSMRRRCLPPFSRQFGAVSASPWCSTWLRCRPSQPSSTRRPRWTAPTAASSFGRSRCRGCARRT